MKKHIDIAIFMAKFSYGGAERIMLNLAHDKANTPEWLDQLKIEKNAGQYLSLSGIHS